MEFDRGWVYKHLDEKPPLVCPCCGKLTTVVAFADCSCYCESCDSEWMEKDGMWSCVQAAGLIKK